jgi:hypothetical protein
LKGRWLDGRFYPDKGYRELLPKGRYGIGGGGVAGYHDQFASLFKQPPCIATTELKNVLRGLLSIGSLGAIRKINGIFRGEDLHDLPANGKTSKPGIEQSYRLLFHLSVLDMP